MSAIETSPAPSSPVSVENVGTKVGTPISVEISTRFLEHFSEQLYSSPQKAFEELISNGWDAGASCVDVRLSADLNAPDATMSVLDNGASMDADGLRTLWRIAFSPKRDLKFQHGRPLVGKFGIGKLATYVLANRLTYICRASDGVIRRVTMDYGGIDQQKESEPERLLSQLPLELYVLNDSDLEKALSSVQGGAALLKLIREGVPKPEGELADDEFGAPPTAFSPPPSGTWTLVVLSGLKPTGQQLKQGVLRRMLEAALPFGSEMAISLNGELLSSSKVDAVVAKEWIIGPELCIDHIEMEEPSTDQAENLKKTQSAKTRVALTSGNSPGPFIDIPGIGRVTGRVKLFKEPISGGKSEERGASNGFHVNVLGRIVNQNDPSFGEDNLSHAAWARFRMTVRADGLNPLLNTNREQFRERNELKVFRAFLRRVFNKARVQYDDDANAGMPDGGDVLVKSLGVLSLNPLRNVVSDALRGQPTL